MQFKDKQLIIFDLDGTLIDSVPDLAQSVNDMLAHYNLQPLTIEEATLFIGNGAKILVQKSLQKAMQTENIPEDFFEEAFKYYFKAYRNVVCDKTYLYPGVMETLEYLNNKGYEMTICTNKPFEFIEPILDKLSVKQYFKHWVGGDSLPQKKPDSAPLLHIAKIMNKDIDKCIMVGDSKNDILAAQNAKMESIGVSYGYNYNESIAVYKPSKVVDNFAQLQALF